MTYTYLDMVTIDDAARALGLGRRELLKRLTAGAVPRYGDKRGHGPRIECADLLRALTPEERAWWARRAARLVEQLAATTCDDAGREVDSERFKAVVDELRDLSDGQLRLLVAMVPAASKGYAKAAVIVTLAAQGLDGAFAEVEVADGVTDAALSYLHDLASDVVEGHFTPLDTSADEAA
jgi:hypothetical protein